MAAAAVPAMIGLTTLKTVLGVREQRRAASIAEEQGQVEGGLFDTNASLAEAQADDALRRGDAEASTEAMRADQLAGWQLAAAAAQGIDVTAGGSVTDVMASDRRLSTVDMATIRQNARREAWGYRTQAAGYRAQGDWARASGRNRAASLRWGAVSTLLSGAGELADIYHAAPKGVSR